MLDRSSAGTAAAVWLAPGRTAVGPGTLVRSGLVWAPLRLGPAAFRRRISLTTAFEHEAQRALTGPYWHLFVLGVDSAAQRRGHGGGLLAPVLATRVPCYLETTEEANLAFYARHGFAVTVHHVEDGLPPFWTMTRAPR